MRCSVVFGVTLRLLVINVFVVFSRKTPPLTTSDVSQLAVRLTCSTSDSVDNTWLVAAFTARTKARYRLRIAISAYPTCIRRPVRGVPSKCRHPVWYGKTKMVWLPDGEKISTTCLFVLTWSTNVTDTQIDRRTDGQTDTAWRHRPLLCIALRGKNPQPF